MQSNNEATIHNERTDHGGVGLTLQSGNKTGAGFPDYSTTDSTTGPDGVARSSLERYVRLKGLLSSSHINSLKNTINSKSMMSPHFQYSTTFSSGYSRDLDTHTVNLISIPSIFHGSKIERGTINLKYYITGTLVGELRDENHNGELIHVGPAGSVGSGSVAGIALYNEGFLILTGSWELGLAEDPAVGSNHNIDYLNTDAGEGSAWYYWGVGANDGIPQGGPDTEDSQSRASASFSLEFSGSSMVPVVTMMAHAPKGQLNYSNNPTYLSHSTTDNYYTSVTSSVTYGESDLPVVNVVSSSFQNPTASFAKETYISKIGLYDEEKNLIGVTTVAKPVKKTEDREFTFKIKMDI